MTMSLSLCAVIRQIQNEKMGANSRVVLTIEAGPVQINFAHLRSCCELEQVVATLVLATERGAVHVLAEGLYSPTLGVDMKSLGFDLALGVVRGPFMPAAKIRGDEHRPFRPVTAHTEKEDVHNRLASTSLQCRLLAGRSFQIENWQASLGNRSMTGGAPSFHLGHGPTN